MSQLPRNRINCCEQGDAPITVAPEPNPESQDMWATLTLFCRALSEFEAKGLAVAIKEIPPRRDAGSLILEILANLGAEADRVHKRKVLLDALRLRHRWHLADVAKLEAMDLSPVARRLVDKLKHSGKRGRGVIRTEPDFSKQLAAKLRSQMARADRDTPPHVRRELYKKHRRFEEFIEPAYRGELALAKQRALKGSTPHERAYEIAEKAVAKAAGISPAQVRKLCNKVRSDRGGKPIPDDEPPISAAELKDFLECGPNLSSFVADLRRGT